MTSGNFNQRNADGGTRNARVTALTKSDVFKNCNPNPKMKTNYQSHKDVMKNSHRVMSGRVPSKSPRGKKGTEEEKKYYLDQKKSMKFSAMLSQHHLIKT